MKNSCKSIATLEMKLAKLAQIKEFPNSPFRYKSGITNFYFTQNLLTLKSKRLNSNLKFAKRTETFFSIPESLKLFL